MKIIYFCFIHGSNFAVKIIILLKWCLPIVSSPPKKLNFETRFHFYFIVLIFVVNNADIYGDSTLTSLGNRPHLIEMRNAADLNGSVASAKIFRTSSSPKPPSLLLAKDPPAKRNEKGFRDANGDWTEMMNIVSHTCERHFPTGPERNKRFTVQILGINTPFPRLNRLFFLQPPSFRAATNLLCLRVRISATHIPRKPKTYRGYSILCWRVNFTNLEITPCVHRCSRRFSARSLLRHVHHKTKQKLFLEQCASQNARTCRQTVRTCTGNILENTVTVNRWQQKRATWMDFVNWQNGRLPFDGLHDQMLQVSCGVVLVKPERLMFPRHCNVVLKKWWNIAKLEKKNTITDKKKQRCLAVNGFLRQSPSSLVLNIKKKPIR